MTLEEYYIEQCRQRMESEFARQRAECDKLGEDINKAMEKHGIDTDTDSSTKERNCDAGNSPAGGMDSLQAGQESRTEVHGSGTRHPNRTMAEEDR